MAAALELDAAALCAAEKGTRSPLSDERILKLAEVLRLSAAELSLLQWAARHDRLVGMLEAGGASSDELALVSKALTTWNYMDEGQRQGWLSQIARLADSALLLHSAVTPESLREVAMT